MRKTISAVFFLAMLVTGSVGAHELVEIRAEPEVASSVEPVTLILTGFATCPFFAEPDVGSRITIRWDDFCLRPGPPAPFEVRFTIGPLPPSGSLPVMVVDGNDEIVAQTRVSVRGDEITYELYDVGGERLDAFVSSLDEVTVRVLGVAECPRLGDVESRANVVRIEVGTGCSLSPALPRESFQYDIPLGRLRPGHHEIRLVDEFGQLILACSLSVFEERPVLELFPRSPSARDEITATVTLPGLQLCPPLLDVTIEGHFVRIDYDEACLQPPPPVAPVPTVSLDATFGPLKEAPYDIEVRDTSGQITHAERLEVLAADRCETSATALCLNRGRFRVTVTWRTFAGQRGVGHAVASTDDSGLFYFFSPENIELLVKVLDGCHLPFERYWVFISGLTDVEVEVEVTDLASREVRTYSSPLGSPFLPVLDTQAFATCSVPQG